MLVLPYLLYAFPSFSVLLKGEGKLVYYSVSIYRKEVGMNGILRRVQGNKTEKSNWVPKQMLLASKQASGDIISLFHASLLFYKCQILSVAPYLL